MFGAPLTRPRDYIGTERKCGRMWRPFQTEGTSSHPDLQPRSQNEPQPPSQRGSRLEPWQLAPRRLAAYRIRSSDTIAKVLAARFALYSQNCSSSLLRNASGVRWRCYALSSALLPPCRPYGLRYCQISVFQSNSLLVHHAPRFSKWKQKHTQKKPPTPEVTVVYIKAHYSKESRRHIMFLNTEWLGWVFYDPSYCQSPGSD